MGPAAVYNCKQLRPGVRLYDLLYFKQDDPNYERDELNVPEGELRRQEEIRLPVPLSGARFFQRRNRNIM